MKSIKKTWIMIVALILIIIAVMIKFTQSVSADETRTDIELDVSREDPVISTAVAEIKVIAEKNNEIEIENLRREIREKEAAEKKKIEAERREAKKQYKVSRGLSVPDSNRTSFKSYMDYRMITNKSSAQYKLQRNGKVYTDKQGFRKIGEDYIVAVGTYYSNTIGERLEITMNNGHIFTVTVGDLKADKHTDPTNRFRTKDGSVIEFLVDTRNMDRTCKKMGDMSYAKEGLKGRIKSIKKIQG